MERPYPKHHRPILEWIERSSAVLDEWQAWKDTLDPQDLRTLGLADLRTPGPQDPNSTE